MHGQRPVSGEAVLTSGANLAIRFGGGCLSRPRRGSIAVFEPRILLIFRRYDLIAALLSDLSIDERCLNSNIVLCGEFWQSIAVLIHSLIAFNQPLLWFCQPLYLRN